MQFHELGLDPRILTALQDKGYISASPIQAQAIPPALHGKDLMAAAQTGTGKTAGFTLPILQRLLDGKKATANQVRALILTPTRELAAQVAENVQHYSAHLPLTSNVVFGGVKINPQMMQLRRGTDVLIATPGRLLDLYQQNAIHFKQLEVIVFDEADRMLDMGFIHDIRRILRILPAKRQTLMFSATFSDDIRALAKTLVSDPIEVSVSPKNSTAKSVEQKIYPVDKAKKTELLIHLIKKEQWTQALVFSRTKHGANKLTKQLIAANISAAAIHGNKSQGARTRALADFKAGELQVLVATDIAARGIDIDQLPQVVNVDLPNVAEDYVHRIGRTGRAGASGKAVSLVSADEFDQLKAIEQVIGQIIDRYEVSGFVPTTRLPTSPTPKALKPKKPKNTHQVDNSEINARKESGARKATHRPKTGGANRRNKGSEQTSSTPDSKKNSARKRYYQTKG